MKFWMNRFTNALSVVVENDCDSDRIKIGRREKSLFWRISFLIFVAYILLFLSC